MENKVGIYRTKNELTLKQLSDRTGISTTTLSKIENEHTNDILLSNAIILAKVLKVDLYELFCIK
nr:MAG TPA: helix-turn-helix domain protein [Caudoviricetes sp.]